MLKAWIFLFDVDLTTNTDYSAAQPGGGESVSGASRKIAKSDY
jgi:hypothetical protein